MLRSPSWRRSQSGTAHHHYQHFHSATAFSVIRCILGATCVLLLCDQWWSSLRSAEEASNSQHPGHLYSGVGEKSRLFSMRDVPDAGTFVKEITTTTVVRETTSAAVETPVEVAVANDKDNVSISSSSAATVMALASGYGLNIFKRFVGSLRRTGYSGHIILGLQPDPPTDVVDYLLSRNVTIKILKWTNCTYTQDANDKDDIFKRTTCAHPYNDIKIRWSRFPLARDWLSDCASCTGPVLITDARDLVFQRDPFGDGSPKVEGLQVFQEDPAMTTKNWLTEWPIRECKNVTYDRPMLCSGTTVGTREAMLQYLDIMYQEMKVWIEDPKCRFNINGDDQSIHNYLFYSGKLPFATSIANRQGGIVNTVGAFASTLFRTVLAPLIEAKNGTGTAQYPGASNFTWIGTEFGITNDDGLLIELDGSVSRVIHQLDRFGYPYEGWLREQPWTRDSGPHPLSASSMSATGGAMMARP